MLLLFFDFFIFPFQRGRRRLGDQQTTFCT